MDEFLCVAIKLVESATVGADPDVSRSACVQGAYVIVTQCICELRVGTIVLKGFRPAIEQANATICSYP
jgi:hypothetical protein